MSEQHESLTGPVAGSRRFVEAGNVTPGEWIVGLDGLADRVDMVEWDTSTLDVVTLTTNRGYAIRCKFSTTVRVVG